MESDLRIKLKSKDVREDDFGGTIRSDCGSLCGPARSCSVREWLSFCPHDELGSTRPVQ
jgi:hypothetical protein